MALILGQIAATVLELTLNLVRTNFLHHDFSVFVVVAVVVVVVVHCWYPQV